MIGLLQRVRYARVDIQDKAVAEIDSGLLVLVGIQRTDDKSKAERLLERLLGYRVFVDEQKKMNLSLIDINGGLLLVPQFTLAADTNKGMRPGFSNAATPETAKPLFNHLLNCARNSHSNVVSGVFGADMQVSLINDGPVTFQLSV
jgi:D-aminoacyl-tRNA deacylase